MPYPRQLWSKSYKILDMIKNETNKDNRLISVIIGADDPLILEEERAIQFVKKIAEQKFDARLVKNGDIHVYGQNYLAERTFYMVENRKLFLVRSKPGDAERLPEFLTKGFIAIGWTETGDLSFANKDDIRMILQQLGYKKHSLGQNMRIVNDFINTMKLGDVVIVPEITKNIVHIGIVGHYQWREEYKVVRMAHSREVKWIGQLEINKLNELVKKFLKLPSTVNKFPHPIKQGELGFPELLVSPIE